MKAFCRNVLLVLTWALSLSLSTFTDLHAQTDRVFTESPSSIKASAIAGDIEYFANKHGGRMPGSWQELDSFYSLSHLDTYGGGSIPDNYILLSLPTVSRELDTYEIKDVQVLAIGRTQVPEINRDGDGRYVIYKTSQGRYLASWYPEDKIEKIIVETHAVVPPAPAVQLRPSVTPSDQAQKANTLPQQTALPDTSSSASTFLQPTSKPVAAVVPAEDTSVPVWLYEVIVLSIAAIIGAGYFLLKQGK